MESGREYRPPVELTPREVVNSLGDVEQEIETAMQGGTDPKMAKEVVRGLLEGIKMSLDSADRKTLNEIWQNAQRAILRGDEAAQRSVRSAIAELKNSLGEDELAEAA